MPWFPNDSHLFMFSLANEHTCTPEENVCHPPVSCCVTGQVCVAESHRNWQRLYESLLPPTIHETGPPEMNSDWSAGIKMKVVFFLVLLIFFGRTYKPYFSARCDFSSGGPFQCEWVISGDQVLSVEFLHANKTMGCSPVTLLSRWLVRHGTLIVHLKITG